MAEAPMRFTVLYTNDLHADYEAWIRQAAFIKSRRAALGPEACLVLDSGDHFDMSVDECWLSEGRLHLELLAELGLDACTPGNNEFYRSPRETLERLSREISVPWLLSTIREPNGADFAGFRSSVILAKNLKVGLLGALIPFHETVEEKLGLRCLDMSSTLEAAARELRAQGAEIVVLLSHCGLDEDRRLARETNGLIDLIVGGHSHTVLHEAIPEGQTLIVQAGGLGKYVGELELEIESGRILEGRNRLHEIGANDKPDPAQASVLERYRKGVKQALDEELCVLETAIPQAELIRLAAELVRRAFSAEFGMMFAPAISEGLVEGPLKLGRLHEVTRSFITPAAFEIQGSQIESLLAERRESRITEARGFGIGFRPQGLAFGKLEFSKLSWEYGEDGPRDIRIEDRPLEGERWYRVGAATHLFSAESGGYPSLDASRGLEYRPFHYLRELLVEHFRSLSSRNTLRKEKSATSFATLGGENEPRDTV